MYIIQHDYRDDIALMNRWNIEDRHCKIVNVRRKAKWPLQQPIRPIMPDFRFPYVGTPSIPQPHIGIPFPRIGEGWC